MTPTDSHLSDISFDQFKLPESIAQGLADAGFSRCTPIQADVLPLALAGQDVAGQAQTGTGKTAAFLVATFAWLERHPAAAERKPNQPRAFIVAPTRELAIQIHKDAELLGRHTGLRLALAYGGTGYEQQRQAIADGCDLLIGTPGRLIDYLKQGVYDLKQLQVAVLDEADRMFDLGFIADIRYLFRRMPPPDRRLSMLFSATLSLRVTELAYEHMNNPEHVQVVAEQVTADRVVQTLYHPANDEKVALLVGLLRRLEPPRSLVFVNTKRGAELVWRYLKGNQIEAAVLSGDVPQPKRQRLLERFQKGELPVLIATDVAARGLHIPDVTHVFNFDLPQSGEDYVHRIGRTARAGASGCALSFACEDTAFYVPEIEEYIGSKIPGAAVGSELLAELAAPAAPAKPARDRDPEQRRRGKRRGASGRSDSAPRSDSKSPGSKTPGSNTAGSKTPGSKTHVPQSEGASSGGAEATASEDNGAGGGRRRRRSRRRRRPSAETSSS